jgi:hypothetical protein
MVRRQEEAEPAAQGPEALVAGTAAEGARALPAEVGTAAGTARPPEGMALRTAAPQAVEQQVRRVQSSRGGTRGALPMQRTVPSGAAGS